MRSTSKSKESSPSAGSPPRPPFSGAISAAVDWIRRRRERRSGAAVDVVSSILDSLGDATAAESARRLVVIVAHPDDEAIGAGAVLRGFPDVTVVHATDGAPLDDGYARKRGFASREAYAAARRTEVTAALGAIGIAPDRIRGLGFADGELSWHLIDLCHRVMTTLEELQPDVVLTHPYEGGHTDHDSTAFAVHLAAGNLAQAGQEPPTILELTSYHNYRGHRRYFQFLPILGSPVTTILLSQEERRAKRRMFEHFVSQRTLLKTFPIGVERFRQAPRYLFTVPPHDGQLEYERTCRKISGEEWRSNADRALQALRSRKQFGLAGT